MSVFLLVGLGNPGDSYKNTRHNVGFLALDYIASVYRATFHSKNKGCFAEIEVGTTKVILLKPQTYMNLSGEAVQPLVQFYKLNPSQEMLVVTDDLDLPVAKPRLRLQGSSGGHNGLKSIENLLGTSAFARLRVGIGRSSQIPSEKYVLASIPKNEVALFEKTFEVVQRTLEKFLTEGAQKAVPYCNQRWEWVSNVES